MTLAGILLQIVNNTDSISSTHQEIEMLKTMSIDELLDKIVRMTVTFSFNLAVAIIVFIVGKFIIHKIHQLLTKLFVKRSVDRSLSTFLLSMIRMVLYFILIITAIGIVGIETSSFLALFASAGVAIGMALSGTLQNFAGGVLILLLKPYKVGDYIEAGGYAGTVKEIQIFNTIILTPDNKSIIIPNGGLSTGSINNYSREKYRRVEWQLGISYGDSVDTAREIILGTLHDDERVVYKYIEGEMPRVDRSPQVYVSALADSSVNLTVRAWVRNEHYWAVYYECNEKFYNILPTRGINFPFPQLDVHLPK